MKKTVLYILAVLGAIFVIYLLKAVFAGFSSTANPGLQVQRAKCMGDCNENKLSDDCTQYCVDQMLEE